MSSIAIIDYGMGNLHSVSKALEHVAPDTSVAVTSDIEQIRAADRVVLPGVGAIRDCMAEIKGHGFDALVKEVSADRPVLGICVGMQAMLNRSQENDGVDCIGLFDGEVEFFGDPLMDKDQRLKVPHMGWNQVKQQTPDHPLWANIENDSRFYFVHSYFVSSTNAACNASVEYGKSAAAALMQNNIFAVQFHPEKSHTSGLQLLKNFTEWDGAC